MRATSNKIGLRTESSTRFEKGLDSETVMPALHRALELVEALDAGDVISGVLDDYPTPKERRTLEMSPGAINELLGIEVPEAEIKELLLPLGFAIDGRTVHIPTFRDDVSQNCDLAEEVARYVGYNNIPSSVLRGEAKAKPTERHVFEERACQWLAGYGFWECATFSFYSPDVLDKINLPQDSPLRNVVTIANPLGKETSTMRTTALPSLMEVVARNCNARNDVGAFYELATVYHPHADTAKLPHEPKKLVLAAYGDEWHFLSLKGVLEALFEEFWLQSPEARRVTDDASYHPGRCADLWVTAADGTEHCVARVGELHPDVMKNYDVWWRLKWIWTASLPAAARYRSTNHWHVTPPFTVIWRWWRPTMYPPATLKNAFAKRRANALKGYRFLTFTVATISRRAAKAWRTV